MAPSPFHPEYLSSPCRGKQGNPWKRPSPFAASGTGSAADQRTKSVPAGRFHDSDHPHMWLESPDGGPGTGLPPCLPFVRHLPPGPGSATGERRACSAMEKPGWHLEKAAVAAPSAGDAEAPSK